MVRWPEADHSCWISKDKKFKNRGIRASVFIACEQLDRICYGAEIEPKFVDVAVKRYLKYFEDSGEKPKDIYVMRNGQKLTLDEVMQDMETGDEQWINLHSSTFSVALAAFALDLKKQEWNA